jgi:putative membrane protein
MRRAGWINTGLCAGLLLSSGAPLVQASPAQAAQSQARSDQDFLEQALGVNELELQLGRLAGERAIAPELKAMGQKMVEKHTELGQQLSKLAQTAGPGGDGPSDSGGSEKAVMSADQRATLARVASQSGRAFDTVFKQTVDAGHIQELAMYREEVSSAVNPQLRELAQLRVVKLQEAVAEAEAPKQQPKHDW